VRAQIEIAWPALPSRLGLLARFSGEDLRLALEKLGGVVAHWEHVAKLLNERREAKEEWRQAKQQTSRGKSRTSTKTSNTKGGTKSKSGAAGSGKSKSNTNEAAPQT
jgi:hypothetical protein